ncbi:MAG: hypothetical protein AAGN66_05515 [Acidobacteriota bacterium]
MAARRQCTAKTPSEGEATLALHIRGHREIPPAAEQFAFGAHLGRKWRFDFAWPMRRLEALSGRRLAVEIQGRQHGIKSRMTADHEKLNVAQALGWTVLQFSPRQVKAGLAIDVLRSIFLDEGDLVDILQRRAQQC